jgi:hypothetical protein
LLLLPTCRRYDEEDEALLLQADADVLQERQKQQEEWDSAAAARQAYIEVGTGVCWGECVVCLDGFISSRCMDHSLFFTTQKKHCLLLLIDV